MDILGQIQEIFRETFDDEALIVSHDTNAQQIEDWDSLTHIRLVAAIEKDFGIKFGFDELRKLQNVGAMMDLIEDKLRKKG